VEETAARLLERNRQISQAEEHLRQEVEDRTAELRGANASLRREITMRAAVESKLRESLAEKELLIREIHHRVKNNLQIVSSILHMQESAVSDSVAATAFADCEQRIRAMSMVHEQLHGSDTVTDIDLDAYVSTLVHSITSSHGNEMRNVSVRVDMAGARTNIDRAIPIGMIVNELVSNSLKHGYPNGTGGSITVALKRDGRQRTIVVQDDGVGLPDAVLPLVPENPSQLGLQLVQALAEQLHGTVEIRHGNGAEFRIRLQGLSPENGQDQRRGAGEQDT
jgi:two-component sensor histidine kinase